MPPDPSPRPRFRLLVEALPGHPAPPERRLARLLRYALRTLGLRSVRDPEPVTPDVEAARDRDE
jgi:hypothetical protein